MVAISPDRPPEVEGLKVDLVDTVVVTATAGPALDLASPMPQVGVAITVVPYCDPSVWLRAGVLPSSVLPTGGRWGGCWWRLGYGRGFVGRGGDWHRFARR